MAPTDSPQKETAPVASPAGTLNVAFFANKKDNQPRCMVVTWEKLVERLLRHEERPDKDGPLWSPAHYVKGSTRANANVLGVEAAVGDFDKGTTWEEAKEKLAEYEYVAHSTHNCTPEEPRFRVVIPFTRSVGRFDWTDIKARIDYHVFGMVTDAQTKDPSRAYYLPSRPVGALRFAEHHKGRALDPRSLPEVPNTIRTTGGSNGQGGPLVPLGKAALDFVANGAPVGEQRSRAVAAARNYLSSGHSVEDTTAALWRGFQACQQEPGREPWTYEEAEAIAHDIASKPGPPIELFPGREELPEFRKEGLGYTFRPKRVQVSFRADYLNHRGDDVTAEILVESSLPGVPSRLYRGRLNLCAPNSKRGLAQDLAEMTRGAVDKDTWRDLLEELSQCIIEAERAGEPFEEVGGPGDRLQQKILYQTERLLPQGKPTLLYGPGGVGKGFIAVALCCATQLGLDFARLATMQANVLYLDWEDDRQTLDMRLAAVARGMNLTEPPRIRYRRCRVPLIHQVNQLSRYIAENRVGFVVVDSVGAASGTSSERSSYEETALRFFDALRMIGPATWLLIDHVSEQGRQNTATNNKAYGSIYKMNEARMAWEVRKDQDAGATESYLGLYNTKCNHGPIQLPIGLKLDFSQEGTVVLRREDLRDSEELSKPLHDTDKVLSALRFGAKWNNELETVLGKSDAHVRTAVSRLQRRGLIQKLPDGRWVLVQQPNKSTPPKEVETVVQEIPF